MTQTQQPLVFNQLKVSDEILRAIEKMGFTEATPIQSQSIPFILEGKDVIAQAPTGTGKTCAFGIPLIEQIDIENPSIQVLVLCPTRELVLQTTDELKKVAQFLRGVKIVPIYGGQPIERQISLLKTKPQILVATPGRLMDHLRRKTAKIGGLKTTILDEADEMLNMGFREDIDTILETVPDNRQTILFSATISPEIKEIANRYQKDAVLVKVTTKELAAPTIDQFFMQVRGKHKVDVLSRLIDTNNFKLTLIFCNTKKQVDELTFDLNNRSYKAEALHGDMKQSQRDKVMSQFRKGEINILIATDVAARGIDVEDIDAVINFDIPNDEEYYVHRIGRTGRAKRKGVSYTFASGKEIYKLRDIMRYTKSIIHQMKTPTKSEVERIKVNDIFFKAKEVMDDEKSERLLSIVTAKLDEEEYQGKTAAELASALICIMLGSNDASEPEDLDEPAMGEEKKDWDRKRSPRDSGGNVKLFINIGTMDRVQPKHLVRLFAENSNMIGKQIGTINIYDKFSFVEVPSEFSRELLSALNGSMYNKRKIAVSLANDRRR